MFKNTILLIIIAVLFMAGCGKPKELQERALQAANRVQNALIIAERIFKEKCEQGVMDACEKSQSYQELILKMDKLVTLLESESPLKEALIIAKEEVNKEVNNYIAENIEDEGLMIAAIILQEEINAWVDQKLVEIE